MTLTFEITHSPSRPRVIVIRKMVISVIVETKTYAFGPAEFLLSTFPTDYGQSCGLPLTDRSLTFSMDRGEDDEFGSRVG